MHVTAYSLLADVLDILWTDQVAIAIPPIYDFLVSLVLVVGGEK